MKFIFKFLICTVLLYALFLIIVYGNPFSNKILVVDYEVHSEKVSNDLKICLVTDLHSSLYGENQEELMALISENNPNVVLLGGDILDDKVPNDDGLIFLDKVSKDYITYYVTGNHEYWTNDIDGIKEIISSYGIIVLDGDTIEFQDIYIGGVDDPTYIGEYGLLEQLKNAESFLKEDKFSVLLSHRPELTSIYQNTEFDLILSGHAHGGQWIIPNVLNGTLAPNQGIFPKYAGGEYDIGDNKLIVSRGLSITSTIIPRIYNRPELVFVTLKKS